MAGPTPFGGCGQVVRRVWVGPGQARFQDAGTGQFISTRAAVPCLTYDFERKRIVDAFHNVVGVANLRIGVSGIRIVRPRDVVTYQRILFDPRHVRVGPNQEIVERIIWVRRDGWLRMTEWSYGLGERYDRSKTARAWGGAAREALGLERDQKATTRELRKAVVLREFQLKTTRLR